MDNMNGYEKSGFNEDDFAAKGSIVSAFDAFRTFTMTSHRWLHWRNKY